MILKTGLLYQQSSPGPADTTAFQLGFDDIIRQMARPGSHQPNIGDPSLHWAAFEHPKLRRFPHPSKLELQPKYLGGGEDGFVFKAEINEHPVAVKIVRRVRQSRGHS